MANWNDPKICVLITPTAMENYPGWAPMVQKLTEQGRLKRHYIRFGAKQKAEVQSFIAESSANVRWKIVRETAAYILVQVTFHPFKPDSNLETPA